MNDINILWNTLRDFFRIKKLLVVLFVAALPAVVALIVRAAERPDQFVKADVYNNLSQILTFGFVLVMLACVFGTNLVAQEVEQKTIVYLLTRQAPRWRILLMKYFAAFVATTLAAWLATGLLMAATGAHFGSAHSPFGRDMLILPVACLAYCGLFLFFAATLPRPLIYGLIYTFGVETWVPYLPGYFKMLSLMAYVHVLAPHQIGAASTTDPVTISTGLAWKVVIGVIIVSVAAACAVFSTSEYVPRDDV